ncbi:tRNA (adenosine(37)-N6)-threonylcarbamoyltransferase complex ATPase subunit type 1 TsaE [Cognatishimia activa]|uniref:tRNA threonylcarbamoyladenosine biosynthesis protein TsaE n=1 Tax=Cognatishimia activa TaxID=1715691 RepID=A0A975ES17_9RHOB|nr:tRNA (adenosine(37)-N6)-threonylcarbamoyltransferase complex ATPase subunit type 1 TsaE [Cognatishimia activa]QTN37113.1 tRNA (adenosine(37)-N6)-threonylcarbamoyltransferase complex ATPase subunit type 1 TsaE [Cognatishimia activa]
MTQRNFSLDLTEPDATTQLAKTIAPRLSAGDVLLFTGDIGAGKTHFARALIQSLLPEPEDVPSPTFTLVQIYEVYQFEIWHADLYRLTSPDEVVELGLIDAFSDALCLVEWPDRLAELAPSSALSVSMRMTEHPGQRALTFTWEAAKWDEKLAGLDDL